jgi:two-component system nitrate/nitrite response regulator NarL
MTASGSPVRIVLVEDHAVVRAGLRMLIDSYRGLSVVGEAQDGAEAIAVAKNTAPDLILLDLDLGGQDGLELIPVLLAASPPTRILVLTGARDDAMCRRAFSLGAKGLVRKDKAASVLTKAIEKVHAGEVWIDRAMMADVIEEIAHGRGRPPRKDPDAERIAALSEREREVIVLLGEGLPNKRIAAGLHVSEVTVRHHLTSIYSKLGVGDRLELLVYAFRHKLATPPEPNR